MPLVLAAQVGGERLGFVSTGQGQRQLASHLRDRGTAARR